MSDSNPTVGADLLAIPDGADAADAGDGMLRIAIQVTPSMHVAGAIALARWPAEIARLAERVRIRIGVVDAGQVTQTGHADTASGLRAFFDLARTWNGTTRRDAASAMWQDIFAPVGFDALASALSTAAPGVAPAEPPSTASTRIADLQLFLDQLLAWNATQAGGKRKLAAAGIGEVARRIAGWLKDGPEPQALAAVQRNPDPHAAQDPIHQRAAQLAVLGGGLDAILAAPAKGFVEPQAEVELGTMFRQHWTRLFGEDLPGSEATDKDAVLPKPVDEPPTDAWGSDPVDAAGRKLSALLALPTLSHYVGLAVQVEIPRSSLKGMTVGAIAAEFVDAEGQRIGGETAWTAFELAGTHFGPAPDPQSDLDADLFMQGYLNLGARVAGRSARFALRSDDVVNTLHTLAQAAAREDDPRLQHYRRGLVLHEFATELGVTAQEKRAMAASAINYMNDLVVGVRPDFAVAPRGAAGLATEAGRWRPVTWRAIRCTHAELDRAFYDEPLIVRIAQRDHGYAARPLEDKNGKLSREDEIFHWDGESLAVHVQRVGPVQPDPQRDLALDLCYSLVSPAPGGAPGMPPLREGIGYVCGCRLVYVNGAGPAFADAAAFYQANPGMVLGGADGKPLVYPTAPLAAPDVHLGWDDQLVRTDDPSIDAAGETGATLVVRDGSGEARRYLTPPRVEYDTAEKQRQFDDPALKQDRPAGALSGARGAWLFGPKGQFPEARFGARRGAIRYLVEQTLMPIPLNGDRQKPIVIDSEEYQDIKYPQSRGTVLVLGPQEKLVDPAARFYADAHGARLSASLHRISLDGGGGASAGTTRDFWKAPERPADAVPVVLEVRPTKPGEGPAAFTAIRDIEVRNIKERRVTLPFLQVAIPKGETYLLRLHADAGRGDEGVLTLRLVHAVEKPLRAPDIRPREAPDEVCATAGVGLRAVNATVHADTGNAPGLTLESWASKVARYEASGADQRCWPSEEGGSTTFFVGRVDFDRKSTGTLRCEALWDEFNESTVSRDASGRWIRNVAAETAQLFGFEVERGGGEARLDLLRAVVGEYESSAAAAKHAEVTGKPGRLRMLSHAFRDSRARELKVKMVATSAFTSFYPPADNRPQGGEWISRFELESSRFEDAQRVWTDCTFRPPPPRIDRILPLFEWDQVPGRLESSRRTAHLRIYLDGGWYASGAGEQLGIVLLGDDAPRKVCDYEDDQLRPYHRYLSQAGADPVRDAAALPVALAARHIRNAPAPVRGSLFLDDGSAASLAVSVLPFTPQFSPDDGLYCDIELDLGSYFPFLQLGLVRYQEHAVEHLRLSHPVACDMQLLPERRLWIEVHRGEVGRRTVVVEGPGFEVPVLGQATHLRNAMRLAVLRWYEDTREWREKLVLAERMEAVLDRATRGYRWKCEFTLPDLDSSDGNYILAAEEYERLPQDSPTGRYQDGEAEFEEVAAERLTFACLQPLHYPIR